MAFENGAPCKSSQKKNPVNMMKRHSSATISTRSDCLIAIEAHVHPREIIANSQNRFVAACSIVLAHVWPALLYLLSNVSTTLCMSTDWAYAAGTANSNTSGTVRLMAPIRCVFVRNHPASVLGWVFAAHSAARFVALGCTRRRQTLKLLYLELANSWCPPR